MVLAHPLDGRRAGIPLAEAGPPLFIAEVASTTTVRNDLEGKREVYAAIGIREYVIFDPMEAVLGVALQAWRLTSDDAAVYDPWEPEADGWWRSRALGLSLRPDGAFLALRHRDGALIEHPRTTARLLHSTRQRLREEQLARQTLEADLEQLRAQLDQRDDQDSPIS